MATRAVLVKLLTDATGAKAGLRETSSELKRFGSYTAEATVKIQSDAAQAKLSKLEDRLKWYGQQPHTADVQIRMGTVARQIERTQAQLRQLTERPHEVKVGINERSYLRLRERIGHLGSIGSSFGGPLAGVLAGAAAGEVGVEAIKSVTEAYGNEQAAAARLKAQLVALGISYTDNRDRIEEVVNKTSDLSGIAAPKLNDAFVNIVRASGNVNTSMRLVGLAADIARAKNLDAAKAGQLVGKVAAGNVSALSRYGIAIKKGTSATEALQILQRRFGGQAAAFGRTQSGALARLSVAWERLKETIGERLAPTLTRAANSLTRFIGQMRTGEGAGGRFVQKLKSIAHTLGAIIGFLVRHRTAIAVAIGAWAAYRLAAVAALAVTRLRLIGMFFGLGARAAEGGAIAGSSFGSAFSSAAGSALAKFALRYGKFLGPIGVAAGFLINAKNAGPDTAGEKRLLARDLASQDAYNADPALAGYPDGGASTAGGRPHPVLRRRRSSGQSVASILAGLGSAGAANLANLRLQESQAQRAYVAAVRQHGQHSAAAIQAGDAFVNAQQAVHDALHPPQSASQRAAARRRRQAAVNPAATPQDRANRLAAQRYADAVRKYGAGSPQALRARDEGNVANAHAVIQSITARMVSDLRKYGPGSQKVVRDQTALAKARARLTSAIDALTKVVKKSTDQNAALLPRLTDVAYHPLAGRLSHAPTVHGLGAAGHLHHHQTTVQVSTPGGMQYPDAEAFSAALQRKLAAKGNG